MYIIFNILISLVTNELFLFRYYFTFMFILLLFILLICAFNIHFITLNIYNHKIQLKLYFFRLLLRIGAGDGFAGVIEAADLVDRLVALGLDSESGSSTSSAPVPVSSTSFCSCATSDRVLLLVEGVLLELLFV